MISLFALRRGHPRIAARIFIVVIHVRCSEVVRIAFNTRITHSNQSRAPGPAPQTPAVISYHLNEIENPAVVLLYRMRRYREFSCVIGYLATPLLDDFGQGAENI